MRIGIVGSRRRSSLRDRQIVFEIVTKAMAKWPGVVVVSGGARGPDSFAEEAADAFGLDKIIHRVPKAENRWDFRQKAFARNRLIVIDSDVVFALVHPDRKGGTENTIEHAHELGKKVFLVDQDGQVYLSPVDTPGDASPSDTP
jgi:predicted Rossmann fold nucleotide-binding protein DprA/Smf involved in DNA uptake